MDFSLHERLSGSSVVCQCQCHHTARLLYNYCPRPGRGRPITRLLNPRTLRSAYLTTSLLPYTNYPPTQPYPILPYTTVPAHQSLIPNIVHYRLPSPRINTCLSSFIFLHTQELEPTGHPSIRHGCFASRLIFLVHHRIRRRYWGAALSSHLYLSFLSLSDETAIRAISQSGCHRRSESSPGTLRCAV